MKDHLVALRADLLTHLKALPEGLTVQPVVVHSQVRPAGTRLAAFPAAVFAEVEEASAVSTAVVLVAVAASMVAVAAVDN